MMTETYVAETYGDCVYALNYTPIGSVLVDEDRDVFQYLGDGKGRVLYSSMLAIGSSINVAQTVSYPVTIQPMGSVKPSKDDKESVLDYLTKVWEEASEPEGGFIPAGTVVINLIDPVRPDYHVWTVLTDIDRSVFANIRIVSSPPKVGFYQTNNGYAYYWDGSTWLYSKGGDRCGWQDYEFSQYIGDVKEDK